MYDYQISIKKGYHPTDLNQLRTFELVIEYNSFTRVAKELNISQPAVSNQILALERELGVRLLERLPRRIILTQAGEVLHEYAGRIINLESSARQSLSALVEQQASLLHIGASPTIAAYILPRLLESFQGHNPQLRVIAEVKPSYEVAQAVSDRTIDLGLIETEVETDELTLVPFLADSQVVVVAPQHCWAGREHIAPEELETQPMIMREPGSATRTWIEQSFRAVGINLMTQYELGDVEAIKNTTAKNLGISILSRCAVQNEIDAGILAIVEIHGLSLTRSFYCIYDRKRHLSPLTAAFLEEITGSQKKTSS